MADTAATPTANIGEYTVSEISAALKRTVEDTYGYVRVRGEISGFKGAHASGHAYFSLKDDKARLEAVVWKLTLSRLRFKPQEGIEVIATGKLTTFPGQSKYQLVIDALEPAGIGALMALLDARRKALAAEGPAFVATIERVSRMLTTPVMRQLNAAVDVAKQDPATAAKQFLQTHGLLEPLGSP